MQIIHDLLKNSFASTGDMERSKELLSKWFPGTQFSFKIDLAKVGLLTFDDVVRVAYPVYHRNYLQDLIITPEFIKALESEISRIRLIALGRDKKRNPFTQLHERGNLRADFIKSEYLKIEEKRSELSSSQRSVIVGIFYQALNKLK